MAKYYGVNSIVVGLKKKLKKLFFGLIFKKLIVEDVSI
jgi:hypothetical protein